MPHFIAEYTDNIEAEADLPGLFEKVHACLGASGVFPLGGIRSRGVRLDTWRMADGKHDYAFVHMTLKSAPVATWRLAGKSPRHFSR